MKISVKLLEKLEWVFGFFALQLSSGTVLNTLVSGAEGGDSPVLQAVWFGIYIISFCLILTRKEQFITVINRDKLLLLLVGIAVFSYHWSAIPALTLRRGVALIGTTLFGVYLATRYSPGQILRLLVWTLSIGALLSTVLALALPSYGVSLGAWRGIYLHKNLMGRLMGLNVVFLLLLNSSIRRYRWLVWAGIALSAGLVVLSTSKGALVYCLALVLVLPFYKSLQLKFTLAVPFLIILILVNASVAVGILDNLEFIVVEKLGKDLSFTGRTVLWELVIEMIKQHPLLGYGYSAFWRGLAGPSAYVVTAAQWTAPHAHNGFLDLLLNVGLLGGTVFILGFVVNVIRSIIWLRFTKKVEDIWPLLFLTATLLYNLAESTLIERHHFLWIVYVVTVFSIPVQFFRFKKHKYTSAMLN